MQTFQDLVVWQKAHSLILELYRLTRGFPTDERYGLTSQMRRAGVSIAANITEGHHRNSKNEFRQFLSIAHSSLHEVKYYLLLARDLTYVSDIDARQCTALADEIGRMLHGLQTHIRGETRHV